MAPLKRLGNVVHFIVLELFPCLIKHGSIEAGKVVAAGNRTQKFPCLIKHGSIEAYVGRFDHVVGVQFPCLIKHGSIEASYGRLINPYRVMVSMLDKAWLH